MKLTLNLPGQDEIIDHEVIKTERINIRIGQNIYEAKLHNAEYKDGNIILDIEIPKGIDPFDMAIVPGEYSI